MSEFLSAYPEEKADLKAQLDFGPDFVRLKDTIENEKLPEHKQRFFSMLNHSLMMDNQTINDLRDLMGAGEKAGAPPSNLKPEERAAFEDVEGMRDGWSWKRYRLNYSIQAIGRVVRLMATSAYAEPGGKPGFLLGAAAVENLPEAGGKGGRH